MQFLLYIALYESKCILVGVVLRIHKSSKEMVEGLNLMTEEDVREKLIVIEQESDYLTQTVDNLLDITK